MAWSQFAFFVSATPLLPWSVAERHFSDLLYSRLSLSHGRGKFFPHLKLQNGSLSCASRKFSGRKQSQNGLYLSINTHTHRCIHVNGSSFNLNRFRSLRYIQLKINIKIAIVMKTTSALKYHLLISGRETVSTLLMNHFRMSVGVWRGWPFNFDPRVQKL